MLNRENTRRGLDVEHAPSGKRGVVSWAYGVAWLARTPSGELDESDDAPSRPGCWVTFGDDPPPIAPAPDISRRETWHGAPVEHEPGTVPVPFDELRLPIIECDAPCAAAVDGKCRETFRPASPGDGYCPGCSAIEDARQAREKARRLREFRKRAKVARRAMPRLAAWCARVDRTGEVHYLIPHVARSGMSRWIELFHCGKSGGADVCWPDTEPTDKREVGDRLGRPRGAEVTDAEFRQYVKDYRETFRRLPGWQWRRRCFVVGGCGMDMVFATVDALGDVFGYADWGNKIRRSGLSRAE